MKEKLPYARVARELGISKDAAKRLYQANKGEFPFDEPLNSVELLGVCE
ncbi:MAG: hypothetical protein M1518_02585 [Candidatus Thermoplasmatota archaeon]|jgi:hypothetical protein|nr:hypothetical protein [Candidatus Thermoplasmatota archaeon]